MRGLVNIFLVVAIFGLFRAHALPTVVPSTKVASSAPAPFIPSVVPSAVPLPFPSALPLAVPTPPARRFDTIRVTVPSTNVAFSAPAPLNLAPSVPSALPLAVPAPPARRFDNVARVEPDDTPQDGYGSSPGRFTLKKTKTPNPAT